MNSKERAIIGLADDADQAAVDARLEALVLAEKNYKTMLEQAEKSLPQDAIDARVSELNQQLERLLSETGAKGVEEAVELIKKLRANEANDLPSDKTEEELQEIIAQYREYTPYPQKIYISKSDGTIMVTEHDMRRAYGENGYYIVGEDGKIQA